MTLGQITPTSLAQANDMVLELSNRLSSQIAIIRQAQTAGFDRGLLAELQSSHARLLTELSALTSAIPSLDGPAFQEWIQRATGFATQISLFEQQAEEVLGVGAQRRTRMIVFATLGALGLAAVIGGLIWYSTKRAPAAKYRLRRRRR